MQFVDLEARPRRVKCVRRSEGLEGLRKLIMESWIGRKQKRRTSRLLSDVLQDLCCVVL